MTATDMIAMSLTTIVVVVVVYFFYKSISVKCC